MESKFPIPMFLVSLVYEGDRKYPIAVFSEEHLAQAYQRFADKQEYTSPCKVVVETIMHYSINFETASV